MELPLFILYLTVWLWVTVRRKRLEGFYSVCFVFGLGGFAYFALIPFEMYIKGQEYFLVQDWIRLRSGERNRILLMSVISLCGFFYGIKLSRYRFLLVNNYMENTDGGLEKNRFWWPIRVLLCVIIVSSSILIIFYRDLLLAQWNYSAAYEITYKSPLYSFVKTHFLIALGLTAGLIKHRGWRWKGKTMSFTIVILIAFMGILTADKEPLLLALLVCASFFEFRKIRFWKFATISLCGVVGIIILVILFNLYRTRMPFGEVLYNVPWGAISFTKLDPAGPMVSVVSVISDDVPLRYGKTYITNIGVIIPKAVWPDRPLSLSEEFARDFLKDYSEGRGLGYSPLAESFLNFHIPGAFIQFLIFGFLFGGFLQFLRKRVFIHQEHLLGSFIYIVGYQILITSFRSSFIGPLKSVILFMAPYCVVFILLRLLGKIASQHKDHSS